MSRVSLTVEKKIRECESDRCAVLRRLHQPFWLGLVCLSRHAMEREVNVWNDTCAKGTLL